jgi:glucose/arabinose dehydrogenase
LERHQKLQSAFGRLLLLFVALTVLPQCSFADDHTIDTETGRIKVETVAGGLDHPWGMVFLPDGRMLVTERAGRLRLVSKDGALSPPLVGVPRVYASGQGGLLDVALDPDFANNGLVYIAYSEPGGGGASTAVARGKLSDKGLEDVKIIFRQIPKVDGNLQFGSRLVFAPDGKLFVTLGERFKFDVAQDLSNHLGKIVLINPDGSVAQPSTLSPASCGKASSVPRVATRSISCRLARITVGRLSRGAAIMTAGRSPSRRPIPNSPTPSIIGTR